MAESKSSDLRGNSSTTATLLPTLDNPYAMVLAKFDELTKVLTMNSGDGAQQPQQSLVSVKQMEELRKLFLLQQAELKKIAQERDLSLQALQKTGVISINSDSSVAMKELKLKELFKKLTELFPTDFVRIRVLSGDLARVYTNKFTLPGNDIIQIIWQPKTVKQASESIRQAVIKILQHDGLFQHKADKDKLVQALPLTAGPKEMIILANLEYLPTPHDSKIKAHVREIGKLINRDTCVPSLQNTFTSFLNVFSEFVTADKSTNYFIGRLYPDSNVIASPESVPAFTATLLTPKDEKDPSIIVFGWNSNVRPELQAILNALKKFLDAALKKCKLPSLPLTHQDTPVSYTNGIKIMERSFRFEIPLTDHLEITLSKNLFNSKGIQGLQNLANQILGKTSDTMPAITASSSVSTKPLGNTT